MQRTCYYKHEGQGEESLLESMPPVWKSKPDGIYLTSNSVAWTGDEPSPAALFAPQISERHETSAQNSTVVLGQHIFLFEKCCRRHSCASGPSNAISFSMQHALCYKSASLSQTGENCTKPVRLARTCKDWESLTKSRCTCSLVSSDSCSERTWFFALASWFSSAS